MKKKSNFVIFLKSNMIKIKLILTTIVLILINTKLMGQTSINSPYSAYGVGDLLSKAPLRNQSMGGISIGTSHLLVINSNNPATYADLIMTSFEISAFGRNTTAKNSKSESINNSGGLNGLSFAFPTRKKFTIAAGLKPYSSVGYSMIQSSTTLFPNASSDSLKILYLRSGSGGLNQVFLGVGFKFFKKLTVGVNGVYTFGNINNFKSTSIRDFTDPNIAYASSKIVNYNKRISYKGLSSNFGVQFSDSLFNKKYKGRIGLVMDLPINLLTQQNVFFEQSQNTGSLLLSDTLDPSISGKTYIPMCIGLGISLEKTNYFTVGLDFKYQDWSKFKRFETSDLLQKSYSIGLGGEWIPKVMGNNYLGQVAYRLGVNYEKGILKLQNTSINSITASFGLGLPFKRTLSRMNLGLFYTLRGKSTESLISENIIGAAIGLTFNETWFIKRKHE